MKTLEDKLKALVEELDSQIETLRVRRSRITRDEEIQELREDLQELWDRVSDVEEHMEGDKIEEHEGKNSDA